jgi:hypothetical protein
MHYRSLTLLLEADSIPTFDLPLSDNSTLGFGIGLLSELVLLPFRWQSMCESSGMRHHKGVCYVEVGHASVSARKSAPILSVHSVRVAIPPSTQFLPNSATRIRMSSPEILLKCSSAPDQFRSGPQKSTAAPLPFPIAPLSKICLTFEWRNPGKRPGLLLFASVIVRGLSSGRYRRVLML